MPVSGMKCFSLLQHLNEQRYASRAGLRLLRGLYAIEQRVAVRSVESREEGPGFAMTLECQPKIRRHDGSAGWVVRRGPASILLREFDGRQSARLHATTSNQCLSFF